MDTKFYSRVNRRKTVLEMNSGKSITERAGYIQPKQQIENLIAAGRRLSAYRKEQYDGTEDDEFTMEIDPTRSPNFDLADASRMKRETDEKVREIGRRAKKAENVGKEEKPASDGKPDKVVDSGKKAPE